MEEQAKTENTAQETPIPVKSSSGLKQKILANKKKILAFTGILVAILLLFIVNSYLQSKEAQKKGSSGSENAASGNAPVPGAIAKVGNEYIFKKDLDVEKANYPGKKDEKTEKILLEKLVKDSIILQSAEKEKIASVSSEIYNSEVKDYGKRMARIKDIKTLVNNKTDHLGGTIVNVWFNNYEPAKIGLEAGKAEALKRITSLHKRVASGEISIQQAGDIIRKDSSYADLDIGYKSNASFGFNEKKGNKITFNPDFDQQLWGLSVGGVSDIYLGKIVSGFSQESEESFYAFGQVTEKVDTGNSTDFDGWLSKQQKNYEIVYY